MYLLSRTLITIKFFLLNSYRITGRRKSWPRALKLVVPGGLRFERVNVEKTKIFTATLAEKFTLCSFCHQLNVVVMRYNKNLYTLCSVADLL